MAKKIIYDVALLPDGRALRILKLDARRMLKLSELAADMMPPMVAGEMPKVPSMGKIATATQQKTIALCVKGITLEPVPLQVKYRAPSEAEIEEAAKAGHPAAQVSDGPDVDAMLAPYIDPKAPEFKRWTVLGERELENDLEDNELSMWNLFEDPIAWRAVLDRIAQAGGGSRGLDPFAGKLLRTSAG